MCLDESFLSVVSDTSYYRSPAITIGVVMVKSVVYYYELRVYVLAVWHSPDGTGICSPYTGDRGPSSAHIIT